MSISVYNKIYKTTPEHPSQNQEYIQELHKNFMPLSFEPHIDNQVFIGHNAVIVDEDKLVQWVAATLMSKHSHILKIISSSNDEAITTAKKKCYPKHNKENITYKRSNSS